MLARRTAYLFPSGSFSLLLLGLVVAAGLSSVLYLANGRGIGGVASSPLETKVSSVRVVAPAATEPGGYDFADLQALQPATTTLVAETGSPSRPSTGESPTGNPAASQTEAVVAEPAAVAATTSDPEGATAVSPVERWASEGFILVRDGQEWDDESMATVDAALTALPSWLRSVLAGGSHGPVYVLVNRDGRTLSGRQPYSGPANFFYTNEGRQELVLFPHQSIQTVLHELGHAYNLRDVPAGGYNLVLLEPEMQSFMAAAGWTVEADAAAVANARDHTQVPMSRVGSSIWPRLSHDDPLEDFANSFALYILAPAELRALSNARYAWFAANLGG